MPAVPHLPWFQGCLELVDLRKRDRVLMAAPASSAELRAVTDLVGADGKVLCIEADLERAEEWARLDAPTLEVVHLAPEGSEQLGTFDALVGCPLVSPPWDVNVWAGLMVHNLRPGGRFVVDLPAPRMSEDLAAAWRDAGGGERDLRTLQGPDEEELSSALRAAGLRRVQAVLATELFGLDSPHELVDLFAPALPPSEELSAELALALTRRLKTTGAIQVLLKRTRVHGIR